MVHKKYTYKNGRRYGPYLYENKRVGDKIVTRYIGKTDFSESERKSNIQLFVFLISLVFLIVFAVVFYSFLSSPTGKASLELKANFKVGEQLSGVINLNLKEGELIPSTSVIKAGLGNQTKEFLLSELLSSAVNNGRYYAEGVLLDGEGQGFGKEGTRETYPILDFEIIVSDIEGENVIEGNESEGINEIEEIEENQENQTEIIESEPVQETQGNESETQKEEKKEEKEQDKEEKTEEKAIEEVEKEENGGGAEQAEQTGGGQGENQNSGQGSMSSNDNNENEQGQVTGQTIGETSYTAGGQASKSRNFELEIGEGKKAEVKRGSVKYNGSILADDFVSLKVDGTKVIVTTDYGIKENGFGEEFLGEKTISLKIDLGNFGFYAEEGDFSFILEHNNESIASIKRKVDIEEKKAEKNESGIFGIVNASNMTYVNVSELRMIKEIDSVKIAKNGNASINLSEYFAGAEAYRFEAINITGIFDRDVLILMPELNYTGARQGMIVASAGNESIESNFFDMLVSSGTADIKLSHSLIKIGEPVKWEKNVSLEAPEEMAVEIPFEASNVSVKKIDESGNEEQAQATMSSISGNVVVEISFKKKRSLIDIIGAGFRRITGNVVENANASTGIDILLKDNATQYSIEYYTDAPVAIEENISNGKRVIVSGPDNLGYENVLSFTSIPETVNVGQESGIKIYWVENNSYVRFDVYDTNGNGKIDYIEWITPHLSNQTFEIILITKAEVLDSNRTFIENIYDYVKERDNVWKSVSDGQYVRITFERNLTSSNDITIYARPSCTENSTVSVNGQEVPCEIYKKKLRLNALRRENG